MKPTLKVNNVRFHRDKIVRWWQAGNMVFVTDVNGETESVEYDTAAKAAEAMCILDNITEIDDIDGL